MRTIGNLLWLILFGGIVSAISTWLLGLLLVITVLAAPLGVGLMEFGKFLFWPFGNDMVSEKQLGRGRSGAWEIWSLIITILYFPFGLLLTLSAIVQALALCLSIVGIPVAMVIFKSLGTYLNPVGKKCVPRAVTVRAQYR